MQGQFFTGPVQESGDGAQIVGNFRLNHTVLADSPFLKPKYRASQLQWRFWKFPNHLIIKYISYSDKKLVTVTLLSPIPVWTPGILPKFWMFSVGYANYASQEIVDKLKKSANGWSTMNSIITNTMQATHRDSVEMDRVIITYSDTFSVSQHCHSNWEALYLLSDSVN